MSSLADGIDVLPLMVELRRDLHAHPELGLDLPRTQGAVLDRLAGIEGVEVSTGSATSSVVVDLVTGDGPTLLLRGDMDALPMHEDTGLDFASTVDGRMHACGHDAHTSMLLGAVHSLAGARERFSGRVRFMFQPGEEGHAGAAVMIDEGVLDGVDAAFALHITPNMPTGWVASRAGAMLASADSFTVTVRGRGGHASMPHQACDPVPIAAEIVIALQTMVTRTINAFDPAVLTVARIESGTTSNVIPETATMEGTIRAVSEATRSEVMTGIQQVAEGIAAAHGATAEVEIDAGYPVTINHAGFAGFAAEVIDEIESVDAYVEAPAPVMGAEDFSYVLQQVPGSMAFLGVCPPDLAFHEAPACHSNRMMLHEPAMAIGVDVHTAVALAFFADPGRVTPMR
ncbi:MAG: M20 family metallopeptidase [Actinomycetota bacterium]|nr:M20 family metallopeptidase [Actinomycetota bacterium]